jgi:hypothetical protein
MRGSASVFLVLCIAVAGCAGDYDGGSGVDPRIATVGCAAGGAGIGAAVAGEGNRGIGALIGGGLGALACSRLLQTGFDEVEEGEPKCGWEDDVYVCIHSEPAAEGSELLADCDPALPIIWAKDNSPAWHCFLPNGQEHFWPRIG